MTPEAALFGDRLAPDGTLVRDNFSAWFGSSVLRGDLGAPLALYHGTAEDFHAFSVERRGEKTGGADARAGFFFAANPRAADQFTWKQGEKSGSIMPVYVRLTNPLYSDHLLTGASATEAGVVLEQARRAGHDGVIFRRSDMLGHEGATCVAFEASQIKSAIGNSGLFSRDSTDITDAPPERLRETDAALRMADAGSCIEGSEIRRSDDFDVVEAPIERMRA